MYLHKHMWCQIKLFDTCDPIIRQKNIFNPLSARTYFRRQNLTSKVGLRTEILKILDNERRPTGIQIQRS